MAVRAQGVAGLSSVVTRRIDSLRPAQQLTLKVAAVLGASFNLRLLQARDARLQIFFFLNPRLPIGLFPSGPP